MTSIEIENKVVSYILRISKRATRMRLAVYRGGDFVVTVPKSVDESFIEKVLLKRAQWIIKKIEYFKKFSSKNIDPQFLLKIRNYTFNLTLQPLDVIIFRSLSLSRSLIF